MAILDLTDTFPQQLREARAAACLSQAEAARRIRVSVRSYQAWELGESFPQPRHRRSALRFIRSHGEHA